MASGFTLIYLRILSPEIQVLLRGVPTHEDGYEADQCRQRPSAAQHRGDCHSSHNGWIFQRSDYRVISVDTDATKMKDAGSAEIYVHRVPNVAHNTTEQPLATGELDRGIERHGTHSNEKIRHR